MSNKAKLINHVYPKHEIVGAAEVFIKGKGWVKVCCTTKEEAMSFKEREDIVWISLLLKDKDGFMCQADFLPSEF